MIANTNDGSSRPPALRCYLNLMSLEGLPQSARALEEVRAAGYDGVQFVDALTTDQIAQCESLGLGRAGLGRVNEPEDADTLGERFAAEGLECATLHVGWGLEDDDEAFRLIEAILAGSELHHVPLYVETHRATIFQDMWRTVQFVKRFPDLRFNGDFSHWYTGLEMVYGGFERKLAFIQPVIERVRFMHGRIGDPGAIQVDIADGTSPYVDHFRALWTGVFQAFLASARRGDFFLFVPELLSERIYYARPGAQSDRWQQSLMLRHIAEECFARAQAAMAPGNASALSS